MTQPNLIQRMEGLIDVLNEAERQHVYSVSMPDPDGNIQRIEFVQARIVEARDSAKAMLSDVHQSTQKE
jgi:hypothetical protein